MSTNGGHDTGGDYRHSQHLTVNHKPSWLDWLKKQLTDKASSFMNHWHQIVLVAILVAVIAGFGVTIYMLLEIKEDIAKINSDNDKKIAELRAEVQALKNELEKHERWETAKEAIDKVIEEIKKKECCDLFGKKKKE